MRSTVLPQAAEPKKEAKTNLPAGFGDVQWGASVNDVMGRVLGKIVFTDEKNRIITRDGEVEYLYGFFYADPLLGGAAADGQPASEEAGGSNLFYVTIRFPYLARADVQKKLEEKYGAPTGEDFKKKQGAVIWNSDKTLIIMWVDNYENAPFCRKISYMSKDIAQKVNDYQKKIFNRTEIEILTRQSM